MALCLLESTHGTNNVSTFSASIKKYQASLYLLQECTLHDVCYRPRDQYLYVLQARISTFAAMANTMNAVPMTAIPSATERGQTTTHLTEGTERKSAENLTVTNASASSSLTPPLPELPYSLRDHKVGFFRPFTTLLELFLQRLPETGDADSDTCHSVIFSLFGLSSHSTQPLCPSSSSTHSGTPQTLNQLTSSPSPPVYLG